MRITGKTSVYLEKGETVPVFCKCGKIYQPPSGILSSMCPKCGRANIHEEQEMKSRSRHE